MKFIKHNFYTIKLIRAQVFLIHLANIITVPMIIKLQHLSPILHQIKQILLILANLVEMVM